MEAPLSGDRRVLTANARSGMSLGHRSISEQPQQVLELRRTDSSAVAAVNLLAAIGTIWIICGMSTVSKTKLMHEI